MDESILQLAEYPNAFGKMFKVTEEDIDGFGHVNNAVYLKWLDATVWAHTRYVGLDEHTCQSLNRGMAVVRHELDYISSAYLDDEIAVFNWLSANDGKLRASRTFQVVRVKDKKTLLRARTDYICTDLSTGRPKRMPQQFAESYQITLNSEATSHKAQAIPA
ncbi:acyl-CoA thioesterase [Thalassotalea montiporae]